MRFGQCEKAILLSECLELGQFRLASGEKSNNKLNIDKLYEHPHHLRTILMRLGRLVIRQEPDLIVGVPSGGCMLAERLHDDGYVQTPTARLTKIELGDERVGFDFDSGFDSELVEDSSRIVIVEDVFNRLTSTRKVTNMPLIRDRVIAAVAIWDRGFHPSRPPLDVPSEALVTRGIPNFIKPSNPYYPYSVPASE